MSIPNNHLSRGLRAELVRRANRRLVFEATCGRAISRAELAEQLDLSTTAVADLVGELIAFDLVRESGVGRSAGGRRPRLLEAGSDRVRTLGVDVRPELIRLAVVDPSGRMITKTEAPCPAQEGPMAVLEAVSTLAQNALLARRPIGENIVALGVSFSAPVDLGGRVLPPDMEGWDAFEIPVADVISSNVGLPVVLDNDAKLGALAETRFGIGRGVSNLVYLLIRQGVGAAIIIDRRIYRGAQNRSGEIGHMAVAPDGVRCDCGAYGCLETVVSTRAFVRYWEEGVRIGRQSTLAPADATPTAILAGAARGDDRAAVAAVERLGEALGLALANIAAMLNPELIVLAGPLVRGGDILVQAALQIAQNRGAVIGGSVPFKLSTLDESGPLLGAAAFALDRLLETDAERAFLGIRNPRSRRDNQE